MADDKAPQAESPVPYFEVKEGRVFIEGTDVTDVVRPFEEPAEQPAAEPEAEAAEEEKAEPETEETEPEPEPEAKPEAEPKEEPKAEPEKAQEPEPKEPGKIKLNLKYKGEEYTEELSDREIAMKLQRLRLLDETQQESFAMKKELEPYYELMKSEWFKEQIKEARDAGLLKEPESPPEPPATVQYEIMRRQTAPDHDIILEELRYQVSQMPADAWKLVDSNPEVFLKEYDRVATEIRAKAKPEVKKEPVKPTPEETKKRLEVKETAKERAKVTKPGTAAEPITPQKQWAKREKELIKAIRDPNNKTRNLELIAELLLHRENQPT